MALAPQRRCNKPGCRAIIRGSSYCPEHTKHANQAKNRPGDPFYSSTKWRQLREAKLQDQPLCQECERKGRITAANEVHHLKPRQGHPELAYEWSNLECLCKACHSRETGKERSRARRSQRENTG